MATATSITALGDLNEVGAKFAKSRSAELVSSSEREVEGSTVFQYELKGALACLSSASHAIHPAAAPFSHLFLLHHRRNYLSGRHKRLNKKTTRPHSFSPEAPGPFPACGRAPGEMTN